MVSIGEACRTRHQIDKFIKQTKVNYKPDSYYFDWLMMGGVKGVSNIISRGFEISPSIIELHKQGEKFIPRDKLSGHTFLHDFVNGWWETDYVTAMRKLIQNMDSTIEKYAHLSQKTDSLLRSNCAVALVYHGSSTESSWEILLETLTNRYNRCIPVINIIESNQIPSAVDGIHTAFIDDTHSPKRGLKSEWEGWDESWYKAFSSLDCV